MSILQQVGRISASLEHATHKGEFISLVKSLARNRGNIDAALRQGGLSPRVEAVFKNAVAAGSISDPTWAGNCAPYAQLSAACAQSLQPYSSFEAILATNSFLRLPMHTRVVAMVSPGSGATVAEGDPMPLTQLRFKPDFLQERKSSCAVAVSEELATAAGQDALERLLAGALGREIDTVFLNLLIEYTGVASNASDGYFFTDLANALVAITSGAASKIFAIAAPSIVKVLAAKFSLVGPVFPNLNYNGGSVA